MAETKLRNKKKQNKKEVLKAVVNLIKSKTIKGEYTEAIGRRKTATARVRLHKAAKNSMLVNGLEVKEYFKTDRLVGIAMAALLDDSVKEKYSISVLVKGSGINAQAEAIRLGSARVLVSLNDELRSPLKYKGYLKRDPRSVERKKFGLLKARKAPAWVKR